jgi:hypothetical protein
MYDQIIQNGKQPNLACVHLPQSLFTAVTAPSLNPAAAPAGTTEHTTDSCTPLLNSASTTSYNRSTAARKLPRAGKTAWWRLQRGAGGACGVTYGLVRAKYASDMVAFGFYSSSRRALKLNPDDDELLQPGDVLVALVRAREKLDLMHVVV